MKIIVGLCIWLSIMNETLEPVRYFKKDIGQVFLRKMIHIIETRDGILKTNVILFYRENVER